MKILIATGIYTPDIGGPATYVKRLALDLEKKGHEVRVVTYSDIRKNISDPKHLIRIIRSFLLIRYFNYFYTIFKLLSWADRVYVQGPFSEGIPVYIACTLKRKSYTLKVVGDYAWEQGRQRFSVTDSLDTFQHTKYGWKVEMMRKLEHLVARHASKIIVPSVYLKKIVSKWGVESKNISVVYNSIESIQVNQSKDILRKESKIDGFVMLSVGRLVPWKGFKTLINIMPKLIAIHQDFKLVIIGDGPDKLCLEKEIRRLNLSHVVTLKGRQDPFSVRKYMQMSDVFVLNTSYEGLPHVILEAFQHQLPVVTTDVGGNSEVIVDRVNGLLTEYNNSEQLKDAIIKVYKKEFKLSKEMIDESLERFDKDVLFDQLLNELDL